MIQSAISNRKVLVFPQALADFPGNLVGALKNFIQRPKLLYPFSGSFRAYSRNADEVIRSLPHKRSQLRILNCVNAIFGQNSFIIHAGQVHDPLDWIENRCVLANQLECVTIPRNH